jgi:sugar lactone lactonase YvrE
MPEGLVFDGTTGLVVIGLRSPDGVVLVDRDGQLVRRVDLDGAPRHLAMAAFDNSGPEPRPVADFASVRQPNSIAVDPETGTVYVAGTADGVLQVVTTDDLG